MSVDLGALPVEALATGIALYAAVALRFLEGSNDRSRKPH